MILDLLKTWALQWKMAQAYSATLEVIIVLYNYAYKGILSSPDLGDSPLLIEQDSARGEGSEAQGDDSLAPHYNGQEGDGYPDAVGLEQRLYDKIRLVILGPLQLPEMKAAIMKRILSTMWQHIWAPRSLPMMIDVLPMYGNEDEPFLHLDEEAYIDQ
jgi:hypothetical protein